jgi:hypothetical protein
MKEAAASLFDNDPDAMVEATRARHGSVESDQGGAPKTVRVGPLSPVTDPALLPPGCLTSLSSMPLVLPQDAPYREMEAYARLVLMLSDCLLTVVVVPWFICFAAIVIFYEADTFVTLLLTTAARCYPRRLYRDVWSGALLAIVSLAMLSSTIIIARNPLDPYKPFTWPVSRPNVAEWVLGVLGITLLWLIARVVILVLFDRAYVFDSCLGRRRHDLTRLRAFLRHIETLLFDKANRMQLETFRQQSSVALTAERMDSGQTPGNVIRGIN